LWFFFTYGNPEDQKAFRRKRRAWRESGTLRRANARQMPKPDEHEYYRRENAGE